MLETVLFLPVFPYLLSGIFVKISKSNWSLVRLGFEISLLSFYLKDLLRCEIEILMPHYHCVQISVLFYAL